MSAITASSTFGNASSKAIIDMLMQTFIDELGNITCWPFNYTSIFSRKASIQHPLDYPLCLPAHYRVSKRLS